MRRRIVFIGRRGTGAGAVLAALAPFAARDRMMASPADDRSRVVFVDGDLETPVLPLLLGAQPVERQELEGAYKAAIDSRVCDGCGRCARVCRFDAVDIVDGCYQIDALSCVGCAACLHECSAGAIHFFSTPLGCLARSETLCGILFHAQLAPGQDDLKLASELNQRACRWSTAHGAKYVLAHVPYGGSELVAIGCSGVDLLVVVTEPSASGMLDLERGERLARDAGAHLAIVINGHDVDLDQAGKLVAYCLSKGYPILGYLSFTLGALLAARGMAATLPLDGQVGQMLSPIWQNVELLVSAL